MEKGKLIALEGIDGTGKSTQAAMLHGFLRETGMDGIVTHEPVYGSPTGKLIKEILHSNERHNDFSLQMLFTVDRAMHVDSVISPALENGRYAIVDRYLMSTVAYSVAAGLKGMQLQAIRKSNSVFPQPDFAFILDMEPEESIKRMAGQGRETDKFEENLKFLRKVRRAYLKFPAIYQNTFLIDANKDANSVHSSITDILKKRPISSSIDEIDDLQISDDATGREVKFILVKVSEKSSSKIIFVSNSMEFHKEMFEDLAVRTSGRLKLEPVGGGRMYVDTREKSIRIWGASTSYGAADYNTAERLLNKRFPDFKIIKSSPRKGML